MNRHDLPYYDNILCVRMSFIEPFCTDWEAVTVNHLIELKRCLIEEWLSFQRAIIEDIRCGFSATYCVRSIYQTLKKFSRWIFSLKDTIGMELCHTAKVVANKATIAKEIANVIEILWIPFIWERYEELKKDAERLPETLTSLEYRQKRMLSLEEENRDKALRTLYSLIIGSSIDEKSKKSDIMRDILNGMKGKVVATYIQAALELNWLSDVPEFSIMKMFWGVEGSQGAISKMFSTVGGSLIKEENLQNAKESLILKLSK